MATCSEFRIAFTSDLHLAHPNNTAGEMIPRLKAAFPRNAETALLDVIALGGDIYDHLLSLPHESVSEIDEWIIWKLRLCKSMNIALWVLRGTPSHDRDQSARFVLLNETLGIGCDVLYVDELKIVWMPKYSIHVLFVPDEWTDSADKTLEEVHQLMRIAGITKVDYAIMHGQFEYQLPAIVKAQKHASDSYLQIVDKLISIGHVHQFSRNDRIIAQGSFDRICHGDEKPKGHIRAVVRSKDDFEITFVETENAKIFKTINCRGLDFEQSHAKVLEDVIEVPDDSHVRIVADIGNPILQSVATYDQQFPQYRWTALAKADEEKTFLEQTQLLQTKEEYVPIEIKADNVQKLIVDSMLTRNIDMATIKLAERKLAELMSL